MQTYPHSLRLNALGFLSRQGKLIYHLTMTTNSSEVVIAAFDRLFAQKSLGAFAIVVLDNASVHRSKAFRRKSWIVYRIVSI